MAWFKTDYLQLENGSQVAVITDPTPHNVRSISIRDGLLIAGQPDEHPLEIRNITLNGESGFYQIELERVYEGATIVDGTAFVMPISGAFQEAAEAIRQLLANIDIETQLLWMEEWYTSPDDTMDIELSDGTFITINTYSFYSRAFDEQIADVTESAAEAAASAAAAEADRIQTGLDVTQTGEDRVATGEDRVQTGLDTVATAADAVATAADRVQTGLDAVEADAQADRARDEADRALGISNELDDAMRNEGYFSPAGGSYPIPADATTPSGWFATDDGTIEGLAWSEGNLLQWVPGTPGSYYRVAGELADGGEPQPIVINDDLIMYQEKMIRFRDSETTDKEVLHLDADGDVVIGDVKDTTPTTQRVGKIGLAADEIYHILEMDPDTGEGITVYRILTDEGVLDNALGDSTAVKLTGNQTITGNKVFQGPGNHFGVQSFGDGVTANMYLAFYNSTGTATADRLGYIGYGSASNRYLMFDNTGVSDDGLDAGMTFIAKNAAGTASTTQMRHDGNLSVTATAPTADNQLTRKDYVDTANTVQDTAIAFNTAKVGITPVQASEIAANTLKVGITPAQATAITDNTSRSTATAAAIIGVEYTGEPV